MNASLAQEQVYTAVSVARDYAKKFGAKSGGFVIVSLDCQQKNDFSKTKAVAFMLEDSQGLPATDCCLLLPGMVAVGIGSGRMFMTVGVGTKGRWARLVACYVPEPEAGSSKPTIVELWGAKV